MLSYFKYQPDSKVSMGKVWNLFAGMSEVSEERMLRVKGWKITHGHTQEIINAALNGSIPLSTPFNLDAYECVCARNDDYVALGTAKKILNIVDTSGSEDSIKVGYGDVSSLKLAAMEKVFDEFEERDAFEACLSELFNVRKKYIIEWGVDPVESLKNSLRGIPEAVTAVVNLVKQDDYLQGLITTLCEASRRLDISLEERLVAQTA